MFRRLSAGFVACMLVALLALSVSADSQTTMLVPRVADGSITIDGVMDDIYAQCEEQKIDIQDLDNFGANPETLTGKFWACYDSNYFYLFVDATDTGEIDYSNEDTSAVHLRDAIGVMLDFDYNREDEYAYSYADNKDRVGYINLSGDGYIAAYHIYAAGLAADDTYHDLNGKINFVTVPSTEDGHIIYEVALPIPADQSLKAGTKIGLGILVSNAEYGERVGQACWTPEGGDMWRWSDACGTAVLGELVTVETSAPAAPEAPATEAPVVDAPAADNNAPAAPATADFIVAPIAVAVLAAAGIVASKKNH